MISNEQLTVFFKDLHKKIFGSEVESFEKLKAMKDDELLLRYATLKAKNYVNEKLSFLIVPGLVIAMSAGMVKFALDFIRGIVATTTDISVSGTIISGGMLVIFALVIISLLLLIIYWNSLKRNKKEYYLIELILKERKVIGGSDND